ncbi:MFS transporter [Bradyrhizobium sp. WBOS7]|uniref:MFS transporter n=1 Tax=Bradyrhizobium betae TaxID=244734 RepID=A0AAE9SUA9_9BRAD|nr:MFS transporter [Bradyrhizobium sp. WBOS2]MDD1570485.1 MFS transporter [Bradyrhizobium sp. WBOS1]MDD1579724.1 MFS transporter [Bradyrhizobium sp. WBOS7]MDD1604443.1 MFS transporter [Bradyrhizobium sp. WBOS16]UUO38958.1 MFS transporter [Bradyrhizobium sp. WBOS01]UUO45142.1 MFS transporter [Bradyrhizobium sp. WBOS02]UUO57550.1 MFS transporter [Bradyrhizobium sp. WBOS07]UUO69417.1 MFS transporter [Bradyrhizobium betae]
MAALNKPVVVSETLTEPVVVADVAPAAKAAGPAYIVLAGISFSHFLNDTMQSLIASVYPILKETYALDFAQIGMITLAFQFTASLLQPVVGHYTDKKAQPYSLAIGMASTFFGLLLLSAAQQYLVILVAAALVGLGSAVFHPESARIARLASGGRYGFAQSVFQLGGSFGTSMGPVLAALIVVPFGQGSIAWFSSIAFLAILILWRIGRWYAPQIKAKKTAAVQAHPDAPSSRRVAVALLVLVALLFSKQLYVSSLSSYYIFYLIDRFGVSTQAAQIYLFIFLAANAVGAFLGGPLGDRFGRKIVIWISILGALPFTLALPYAGLVGSAVLSIVIGLIISSTTSSIIVFAQELVPHRFGMISGVFFGVAFGIGGLGAAVLGELADRTSIEFVYQVCAYLPAIGLLAVFLPKLPRHTR